MVYSNSSFNTLSNRAARKYDHCLSTDLDMRDTCWLAPPGGENLIVTQRTATPAGHWSYARARPGD